MVGGEGQDKGRALPRTQVRGIVLENVAPSLAMTAPVRGQTRGTSRLLMAPRRHLGTGRRFPGPTGRQRARSRSRQPGQ